MFVPHYVAVLKYDIYILPLQSIEITSGFSNVFVCVVNQVSVRVDNGLLLQFIHKTSTFIFISMTEKEMHE
jgi:hypothetical protein